MEVGEHAVVSGCPEHRTIQPWAQICTKVHRMITMRASPRQTDRETDGQMDEHHDNGATNERKLRPCFQR